MASLLEKAAAKPRALTHRELVDVLTWPDADALFAAAYDAKCREIGILYFSNRNERALRKILKKEELEFEELYSAKPHVFLCRKHPLAKKKSIRPEELDAYPYITYEQGVENALYFAEEVMPAIDRKKNIRVRDRATMTNLILGLNGFTVASGVHAKAYNPSIVSIPLKLDDAITVGVISRAGIPPSPAARAFIESMRRIIASSGK